MKDLLEMTAQPVQTFYPPSLPNLKRTFWAYRVSSTGGWKLEIPSGGLGRTL